MSFFKLGRKISPRVFESLGVKGNFSLGLLQLRCQGRVSGVGCCHLQAKGLDPLVRLIERRLGFLP